MSNPHMATGACGQKSEALLIYSRKKIEYNDYNSPRYHAENMLNFKRHGLGALRVFS